MAMAKIRDGEDKKMGMTVTAPSHRLLKFHSHDSVRRCSLNVLTLLYALLQQSQQPHLYLHWIPAGLLFLFKLVLHDGYHAPRDPEICKGFDIPPFVDLFAVCRR
jgi:hypothetical protein